LRDLAYRFAAGHSIRGVSARTVTTLVDAMAQVKEGGLSDAALAGILAKKDWD